MPLPTDPAERKKLQLFTFFFGYFPKAWLEVVRVARVGNDQHNPGEPLHWARGKSTDQMNAAFNHIFDYGSGAKKDTDGCYHLAKAIWRLKAQLELDIEAETAGPAHYIPEDPRYPNRLGPICGHSFATCSETQCGDTLVGAAALIQSEACSSCRRKGPCAPDCPAKLHDAKFLAPALCVHGRTICAVCRQL